MDVEGLFKLVLKVLCLLLLLQKLLFEKINLALKVGDALGLFLSINELTLILLDLVLLLPDVHDLLLVVDFTLFERRLLDLDLFIEKVKLFVSFDQLS